MKHSNKTEDSPTSPNRTTNHNNTHNNTNIKHTTNYNTLDIKSNYNTLDIKSNYNTLDIKSNYNALDIKDIKRNLLLFISKHNNLSTSYPLLFPSTPTLTPFKSKSISKNYMHKQEYILKEYSYFISRLKTLQLLEEMYNVEIEVKGKYLQKNHRLIIHYEEKEEVNKIIQKINAIEKQGPRAINKY